MNFEQMAQAAPQNAIVFDTLYRQGEWVDAGHPVVQLLPPENIEVRAFVPRTRHRQTARRRSGQSLRRWRRHSVYRQAALHLSAIRIHAAVIYSEESRAKLVFMTEIDFDPATAAKLHPGQPVDVEFDK